MPRYVILLHEMPANSDRPTHFDLMLEENGVLRSWAMDRMPAPDELVSAQQLDDHRLAYLDFEGQVSGNRGRVSRVAAGMYELTDESKVEITVRLHGEKLSGELSLTREDDSAHLWRVSFVPG